MALFPVLRRQTNRGHPIGIGASDGADLATVGRSTSGVALLYNEANTTSVTIGGGASLSALCDLRDTNPTTLRSASGQNLQLDANGAASCLINTNGTARVTVNSAGGVNVGSATAAVAAGDLAAGDGTREMIYDASGGVLSLTTATANSISLNPDSAVPIFMVKEVAGAATANMVTYRMTNSSGAGVAGMVNRIQWQGETTASGHTTMGILDVSWRDSPVLGSTNAQMDFLLPRGGFATTQLTIGNSQAASGATRVEIPSGLMVGPPASITAATTGDIVAGDGTREMFYDASAGRLALTGGTSHLRVGSTTSAVALGDLSAGSATRDMHWDESLAFLRATNTNSAERALFHARNDSLEGISMWTTGSTRTPTTVWDTTSTGVINTDTAITGGMILSCTATAPIRFGTASTVRWQIDGSGHLLSATGVDNTHDIGASGATRPRTGYFGTALNIGNGITPSAANGDLVVGDGTRSMVWDASADLLSVTGDVTIGGDLTVNGTTTSVNSEVVNIADNHIFLNNDYTTVVAQTGGLVVNYLPTATTSTTATGGFATSTTVNVVNGTTIAAGDYVQVSGANLPANNGLYEVLSVATGGDPDIITIDSTPTHDFGQNVFTVDATDTTAVVTKVNVSVMRAGTDGAWEVGTGSDNTLTFTDIALSSGAVSWSTVLGVGATSGANNPSINTGQKLIGAAELTLEATGANEVQLRTNSIDRVNISSAGHMLWNTDNTLDVGASGATRPRTTYIGTSLEIGPTGGGSTTGDIQATDGSGTFLSWANTPGTLFLESTKADSVNLSVQSPGTPEGPVDTVAQLFSNRTHATGTGAWLSMGGNSDGVGGLTIFGCVGGIKANTTAGNNGGHLAFATRPNAGSLTTRWSITDTGHYLPATTNTYDIGTTGLRVKDIYLSGSVISSGPSAFSYLNVGTTTTANATGELSASDGTRSIDYDPTTNRITFGGATGLVAAASGQIMQLGTLGAQSVQIVTNSTVRWDVTGAGHLTAGSDNTYDIGASGATRPRTAYLGTSVEVGTTAGSSAAGDIQAGDGTRSMVYDASLNRITFAGATGLVAAASGQVMQLGTLGAQNVQIVTNSTVRWDVTGTGHLLAATDNTIDIGASGATRPRTVYAGTSLEVGTTAGSSAAGDIQASDGTRSLTFDASAGNLQNINGGDSISINPGGGVPLFAVKEVSGAAIANMVTWRMANSAGAGVAGMVNRLQWQGETTASGFTTMGILDVSWRDSPVLGSNNAQMDFFLPRGGFATVQMTLGNSQAASGATRLEIPSGIMVGPPSATVIGVGDIVASDATRSMVYDASANSLAMNGAAASISSTSAMTLSSTADLTLGARSAAYNLNDASNTTLTTTNQTIVGAINELDDNAVQKLATVTGIDATATGTTNLYTVPTGKTAIIEKIILRTTAATAAVGDSAAGVGIAAGEDDIVASQILTGLNTVDDGFVLSPGGGKFRIADAAEIVKLGIDTADTGTALTLAAEVIGYLI